jgi:PIN domain nuclease of toxin-antitoxin system
VTEIVLDSSALIAVIHGETGADAVAPHMDRAAVSAVNLAETYGKLLREIFRPEELRDDVASLVLDVRPFDAEQAFIAGKLEPATKPLGLSLGDRACLALAISLGLPVLTGDRQWLKADVGVDVRLFR